MIRINNIKLPVDYSEKDLMNSAVKALRTNKSSINSVTIIKRSVDARKKDNVHFTLSLGVTADYEESLITKSRNSNVIKYEEKEYSVPKWTNSGYSPIIVGAGPGGLFAGLVLARSGANPIIVERGKSVDDRTKDVENFFINRTLNVNSNVQFGEGGAGAFSDGKLTTGKNDARINTVFKEFVNHGAPKSILYSGTPHIGTDRLKPTIKNIREEIIALGGKFMFSTTLTDLIIKNGTIEEVEVTCNSVKQRIPTNSVIIAIGHSARDTFRMIYGKNIAMEQKAFSIGARIEHLQEKIDKAQYGAFAKKGHLEASSYKLSTHLQNKRGVYTFCMCPGGEVVNATSEENAVVTNGMSYYNRDDVNSNSALLVGVSPSDFNTDDVLGGVYLQQKLENKAYMYGGESYKAPVQKVGDFMNCVKSSSFGEVKPSIKTGTEFANLDDILPDYITDSMKAGLRIFNNRIKDFAYNDALLTGVETRSSSPVRILRNENRESISVKGLYPCGEGAGYAGGIVSAAVDGIKCAENLIEYANERYK